MRFMIIVKATKDSEAGVMPDEALIAQMAKYHESQWNDRLRFAAYGSTRS